MPARIAIPMPHSGDREYAERAIPQYEHAVQQAGGEPVRIPLDLNQGAVTKLIEHCDAILLPGSKADVDPAKFGDLRSPHTAASDYRRDAVDELLLQDAYNLRKPILGICYGLQILNVYRMGSLVQHIPDFLPEETRTRVNHEAGKTVSVAHEVEIEKNSTLAALLCGDSRSRLSGRVQLGGSSPAASCEESRQGHGFTRTEKTVGSNRALAPETDKLVIPVNSSHHQSANSIGDGLRIVARCPDDGIIEALEGTSPEHFVLAVQWHPERSVDEDDHSRAIFRALVEAARQCRQKLTGNYKGVK